MDSLTTTLTTWGARVLGVLILLYLAFRVAHTVQHRVTSSLKGRNFDATLSVFFGSLLRWVILIGAILACLSVFGIETTSFAAVLGAAGLAIGLAFQGTLSNFSAGVMLLVFRPFKVGDFVTIGGTAGVVVEIGLFTCAIDTPDGQRFIVPNSAAAGGVIQNGTYHPKRRVQVTVSVAYSADLDKTRAVLETAVANLEGRDPENGHAVVLDTMADSAVIWQVRVWAKTSDFWAVRERTTYAVKTALDRAGISIPFPQMDVHLRKD